VAPSADCYLFLSLALPAPWRKVFFFLDFRWRTVGSPLDPVAAPGLIFPQKFGPSPPDEPTPLALAPTFSPFGVFYLPFSDGSAGRLFPLALQIALPADSLAMLCSPLLFQNAGNVGMARWPTSLVTDGFSPSFRGPFSPPLFFYS